MADCEQQIAKCLQPFSEEIASLAQALRTYLKTVIKSRKAGK